MPLANEEYNRKIFMRDHFQCVYCDFDGSTFPNWEYLVIDHFKPRGAGGGDDWDNLKTCCIRCNTIKSDKVFSSLEEARARLSEVWGDMRLYWETNVKPLVEEDRARRRT